MSVAGYSGRSLSDKLGIRAGTPLIVLGAPRSYRSLLGALPPGTAIQSRLSANSPFIHCFVRERKELAAGFASLAGGLSDDGMLWISWPKKASGVETDLTENVVREIGLSHGLVDVKVCAVDDVWSGLKFVRRVADRRARR